MGSSGHNYNIDINLRTIFDNSAGAQASRGYREMIAQLVQMAKDAGYQIEQSLLTATGKFDKRKIAQATEWLSKSGLGLGISADIDSTTKQIKGFTASMSSALGDSKMTRTFRDFGDGLVQQSERASTSFANIEQEYNRLYGELDRAVKRSFQLQRQEVDQTSAEYKNLDKYIQQLKEDIDILNQKQGTGVVDGKLQGDSSVAKNQRRLAHRHENVLADIDRKQLGDAETKLANTTKEWYSARVQLKQMLVSNTKEKGLYSAEELSRQRDYISNLGDQKTKQQEIYEKLGGNVKQSQSIVKAEREGTYALNQQNKVLNQSTSILDKIKTSFGGILKGVVQAGISWKLFAGITRTLNESIEIVKDLDSAMVDLQMATGQTKEEVRSLLVEYNKIGKDLGATTTEVAKSADTWLKI